jgi:malate/lactate dehydrogenase
MVTGGAGIVGAMAVEYLVRRPEVQTVYVADINKDMAVSIANNAVGGAALHGYYPNVKVVPVDLTNVGETALTLKKLKPDAILNVATLISSFWYGDLIYWALNEQGKQYDGRLAGHTLAKDLALIHFLMKAVKQTDMDFKVVNIAFPDHTNYVLGKLGISPTCGGGTLDLTVQGIRYVASQQLKVPMHNVNITMVAHHGLRAVKVRPELYWIKLRVGEQDVTDQFDLVKLVSAGLQISLPAVGHNAAITASSGVKNTLAILTDSGLLAHVPGPQGACGGYPVRLSHSGAEIVLPQEVTKEKALEINTLGMQADGIQKVDNDGTAHFTSETCELLDDILGIQRKTLKPEDSLLMSRELVEAYKKIEKRKQGK